MTAPTLRQLLADVLAKEAEWTEPFDREEALVLADALLELPELRDIIDLAAWWTAPERIGPLSPAVRAMLDDWRTQA